MGADESIEFETDAQRRVYAQVKRMLQVRYPDAIKEIASVPVIEVGLRVQNGSAKTYVAVLADGEHEVVIRSTAWVLRDVEPSFDLYRTLLLRSGSTKHGGYFVNEEGDIGFSHTIVGSTLDEQELFSSVLAVATTADTEDDDLRSRFGGYRAIDDAPAV